jgi:hypothetical protein
VGNSELHNICVYLLGKTPTVVVLSSHTSYVDASGGLEDLSQVSYKPSGET